MIIMNTRPVLVAIKVKRDGTCIAYNSKEVDVTKKLNAYVTNHNLGHGSPIILKSGLYHANAREYPNGEIKTIDNLSVRM